MSREYDNRVVIYPNYIDCTKTIAEGRKIPKQQACDGPNVVEIVDCCVKGLGLAAEYETKYYCRDFLVPGRVRVQLFNAVGQPVNKLIPNRRTLLVKVADLVPKHPGRVEKPKQAAQAKAAAATQTAAAPKASGKKGKKGRR